MSRFTNIKVDHIWQDNELVIELSPNQYGALSLELTLLVESLTSVLLLELSDDSTIALSIHDELGDYEHRAKVTKLKHNKTAFEMSPSQTEYLQATLLRNYRDGISAVGHVHIEGLFQQRDFDLTVMFASYAEPMSEDDARKLLDS